MIRLDTTTRKLQLLLAGAPAATQPDCLVCYADKTASAYTGGSQLSVGNGVTAVDICDAPAASTIRIVDFINIRNNDSASIVCTVRLNDNATLYKLITFTLLTGETLQFLNGVGWLVLDVNGNRKESTASNFTNLSASGTLSVAGNTTLTGDLAVNGGDLTSSAAAFNLLATPMTVTAFGAASVALNIGHASAAAAFPGGISIPTGKTLAGAGAINITGAITGAAISGSTGTFSSTVTLSGVSTLSAVAGYVEIYHGTAVNQKAGGTTITSATSTGLAVTGAISTTAGNNTFNSSSGNSRFVGGVVVVTDSTNNLINNASTGAGTTTLYIGNQAITTSSDVRLKANIIDTQRDAMGIFNQLRVVDHTWDDPSDTSVNNRNARGVWTSLIAQEADSVIPWIVNRPRNGSDDFMWTMDLQYMAPLFVRGFQQVESRLIALEAKLQ